jgi:glycosyltransferase involved in cell wall biosynthesis
VRILFISGDAGGGSFRSTLELARRLCGRGHAVGLLARDRQPSRLANVHRRLVNAATKLEPLAAARPLWSSAARIGRRPRVAEPIDGVQCWRSKKLENSFSVVRAEFRPDAVVCSSIGRVAWRKVRDECERFGLVSVLYMREESSIGHLEVPNAAPTLLIANAAAHTARAAEYGVDAVTIPSVISLDRYVIETSRERVLYINPIERQGLATALGLAAACPEISFVFSESWILDDADKAALLESLRGLANAEFRSRVDDPQSLYGDASVLLAPYLFDGRPRVVPEAQANGIPVLATNLPAIAEVVGPGGVLVAPDADVGEWARALRGLLAPENYDRLSTAALEYVRRSEVDPEQLVSKFEETVGDLIRERQHAADRQAG